MPSLYCLRCESPVFRIISELVDEYCCLRLSCENFKLSVRESATGICVESETVFETKPRHRVPLESHTHHAAVAGPSSQPTRQQGSPAIRQRTTAPTPEANHVDPPAGRSDDLAEVEDREWMRILQKSLSEQVSDGEDPIAETETWINRSTEQRRSEVPPNGRVKRPHNAFILYRRAYTSTAHRLLGHTGQTTVVRAVAHSWRMESVSVQAHFFGLAAMDKTMHQQAFPNYRF